MAASPATTLPDTGEDPAPGGKRERNKEQNRAAILRAAQRCFTRHGFDGVTVRDIIGETGLATGTFYNYFQDKEEVFSALIEDVSARMNGELHVLRERAPDLQSLLQDTYLHVFRFFAAEPELFRLLDLNDSFIRSRYHGSVLSATIASLEQDLDDAMQRGVLPPVDVGYLAGAFYGVAYEMIRVMINRPEPDPDRAAAIATQIFLGGIGGVSSAS